MVKKSKTESAPTPVAPEENAEKSVIEKTVEKPKVKKTKKKVVIEADPVVAEAHAEPVVITEEAAVAVEAPAQAEPVVIAEEEVVAAEENFEAPLPEKKKRRLVTKENLLNQIEEFNKELIPILENGGNKKLAKVYKVIVADTYRLLKIKTAQKRQKDATNSGFMRPVKASPALESFLSGMGENLKDPLTRAHLTTLICKYIKDKDLQNPSDRRIIFPDDALRTLFQIKDTDAPLTYYNIQQRLQPLVSRIEEVA